MAQDSQYLSNISILLVEPNSFMRTMVRNVLNVFGARRVVEASDGADAFKIMNTFVPDIVLTEWSMEPVDGLDFVRLLRTGSDSPNPYVPVIMMTAHTARHRVIEARDTGITEFVVKPLSPRTLLTRMTEVIERPRSFVRTTVYFGPDRRRRRPDG